MAVQKGKDVAASAGKSPAPSSSAAASSSSAKRKKACASRPPKPSAAKRPRLAALKFVDDAAAEADDDGDSDSESFNVSSSDDEGRPVAKASSKNGKEKPKDAPISNRMRHVPFFVKEEELSGDELEELIKERYGRHSTFAEDDKKDVELGGPFLHPSQDPIIWKVKCMMGRERQIALCLLQKFVDTHAMGNKLPVRSSFSVDHVKGYIFIEADKETDVIESCKGFCNLYTSKMLRISKDEIPRLLSVKKVSTQLSEGAWVRMKSGNYKGDLAQVIASELHTQKAIVKLIPRIDLQALAKKFGGGESLRRAGVPSPRLMSSRELEDFRPHIHTRRDKLTGVEFDILDGMMLKDGYLYKKVSVSSFSFLGVEPSKDELAKFEAAKKDDEEELHWISNMFGEKKKLKIDETVGQPETSDGKAYEVSDLVLFGCKSFGVIIGKKCDTYQILKGDSEAVEVVTVQRKDIRSSCYDKKFAASDHNKKTVSINDNVRVLEGSSEGREGTVRHMYKGTLFIYDERQTENCGFFCAKSSVCENLKKPKRSSNDKTAGSSSFSDFGVSMEAMDEDNSSRRPRQIDIDSPFSIGQTLRIRVGPLKGYLCRVISLRRTNMTVKLDSLAKIITVKNSDVSELKLKDSGDMRDNGIISSNQFGTEDLPSDQGWGGSLGNSWDLEFPLNARSSFASSFGTSSFEGSKADKDSESDIWGSKSNVQKIGSWDKEIGAGVGPSSSWNIENKSAADENRSQGQGWETDSSGWNKGVGTVGVGTDAWEKTKPPDENIDGSWDEKSKMPMNPPEKDDSSWEKKKTDVLSDSQNSNWSKTPNCGEKVASAWGKDVGPWSNSLTGAATTGDAWSKTVTQGKLHSSESQLPAAVESGGWNRASSANVDAWTKTALITETGVDSWNDTKGQRKEGESWGKGPVVMGETSGWGVGTAKGADSWKDTKGQRKEGEGWGKAPVAMKEALTTEGANASENDVWSKAATLKSTISSNAGWGKVQDGSGNADDWAKSANAGAISGPTAGWSKQSSVSNGAGTDFGSSWDNGGNAKWGSEKHSTVGGGSGSGSDCFKCGQSGHRARECPSSGGGGGGGGGTGGSECFKCGQSGHRARECPSSGGGGGGTGGSDCFKCGQSGHWARECPSAPSGGGTDCFKCGQSGHRARDCPSGPSSGGECFNCGQSGHRARDCPSSTGGNRNGSDCFKCGQPGHRARECPSAGNGSGTGDSSSCFKCGQSGHRALNCTSRDGVGATHLSGPKHSEFSGGDWGKPSDDGGGWGKPSWSADQKKKGWGGEISCGAGLSRAWNDDSGSKISPSQDQASKWEKDPVSWNASVGTSEGASDALDTTKLPNKNSDKMWGGKFSEQVILPGNANCSWEKKNTNSKPGSWSNDRASIDEKNGNEFPLAKSPWSKSAFTSGTARDACGKSSADVRQDSWESWGKAPIEIEETGCRDKVPERANTVDIWARQPEVTNCGVDVWNTKQGKTESDSWGKSASEDKEAWARLPEAKSSGADVWNTRQPEAKKCGADVWNTKQGKTENDSWGKSASEDKDAWARPPPEAKSCGADVWNTKLGKTENDSWGKSASEVKDAWARQPVAKSCADVWNTQGKTENDCWGKSGTGNNASGWDKLAVSAKGGSSNVADAWGKTASKSAMSWGKLQDGTADADGWTKTASEGSSKSREPDHAGGWNKIKPSGTDIPGSWDKGGNEKSRFDKRPPTGGSSSGTSDCFKCGQSGHWARECPSAPSSGGRSDCFKCGQPGHRARDCPSGGASGGSSSSCFKCGQPGHWSRECSSAGSGAGTGSSFNCFKCGQTGHRARDCPSACGDIGMGCSSGSKFRGSGSTSDARGWANVGVSGGGCGTTSDSGGLKPSDGGGGVWGSSTSSGDQGKPAGSGGGSWGDAW